MAYPSDLSNKQWNLIKHHFDTGNYGKSRKHKQKVLINAIMYIQKTGCQWRFLPKTFPSWKTVYTFYKRSKDRGTWEKVMKDLVEKARIQLKRSPKPTYGIIDSQSVKTASSAEHRGIDGGKKNKGEKKAYCD